MMAAVRLCGGYCRWCGGYHRFDELCVHKRRQCCTVCKWMCVCVRERVGHGPVRVEPQTPAQSFCRRRRK